MTELHASSVSSAGPASPLQGTERQHPAESTVRWSEDLALPGVLHLAILRSPYAHARLTRVDVDGARDCPGVVAVHTGAELAEEWTTLPFTGEPGQHLPAELRAPPRLPLAVDTVRFAGEPVAVVAATSAYAAVDALDAIEVDYEPLPPVLDVEDALAPDAPLVHDAVPGNRCYIHREAHGVYESARERADVVLARRFYHPWPVPDVAAPPSVVVDVDAPGGTCTVWSDTRDPNLVRDVLARVTGVPATRLRVLTPGPTGTRDPALEPYAEDAIALLLARKLGRPTMWSATGEARRRIPPAGDVVLDVEVCARRDGSFLGLRLDQLANVGAYLPPTTFGSSAFDDQGGYLFPARDVRCTGVFTTMAPAARVGPDRSATVFVIERVIDELAAELGLDPVALRQRNWARPRAAFDAVTSRALELVKYDELRRQQRERGPTNPLRLGIGTAVVTFQRPALADPPGDLVGRPDGPPSATVRVLPTGRVEVTTVAAAYGHGHLATLARVAAETLQVPLEDVRVVPGNAAHRPTGGGASDARMLVMGGMAVLRASERLIEGALGAAARALGCEPDELDFGRGAFRTRRAPHRTVTLRALASTPLTAHGVAPDSATPRDTTGSDTDVIGDVRAAHVAVVEVDTETGVVRVVTYAAVDDAPDHAGSEQRAGEPSDQPAGEPREQGASERAARGQRTSDDADSSGPLTAVRAGVAMAIERTLVEPSSRAAGNGGCAPPMIVGGPTATTSRPVPEPLTERLGSPRGQRLPEDSVRSGVWSPPKVSGPLVETDQRQAAALAAVPAVVNAVVDALRPHGVRDLAPPCTPERVWNAVQAARVLHGDTHSGNDVGGEP